MSRRSIYLLSLCLFSLAMAHPQPADAECEFRNAAFDAEGSGTGGTGFGNGGDDDGSGAGGTGIYAQSDSGAGGTGLSSGDDGMSGSGAGGTGIMGLITGFGSVCVNGLKIDYDSETAIQRNGMQVRASELAVGQVVRIHTAPGRPFRATHLAVESALAGPVDRVDAGRGMLWVMGQPVELPPGGVVFDRQSGTASSLGEIKAGSYVDVSGLRRGDGVVVASRLERGSAESKALITGTANRVSANTVYVGGLRSTTERGQPGSRIEGSERVLLQGSWNSETKTLEHVQVKKAPTHHGAARRLSVQGYLATHHGGGVGVQGTRLDLRGMGDLGDLRTDTLVRVEGRLDERGRLRVRRIVVEERGRSGMLLDSHSDQSPDEADEKDRSGREDREDREDRSKRRERPDRTEREPRPERTERRVERPGRADRSDR